MALFAGNCLCCYHINQQLEKGGRFKVRDLHPLQSTPSAADTWVDFPPGAIKFVGDSTEEACSDHDAVGNSDSTDFESSSSGSKSTVEHEGDVGGASVYWVPHARDFSRVNGLESFMQGDQPFQMTVNTDLDLELQGTLDALSQKQDVQFYIAMTPDKFRLIQQLTFTKGSTTEPLTPLFKQFALEMLIASL